MRAAFPILAGPAVFAATATLAQPPSDLELYSGSSLMGLHSHPVGSEGRRLEHAERALGQRRARAGAWLVQKYGESAVWEIDRNFEDEMRSIDWVRGPTLEEEWRAIRRAQGNVRMLERRMREAREQH